jgi:hypothetical protein
MGSEVHIGLLARALIEVLSLGSSSSEEAWFKIARTSRFLRDRCHIALGLSFVGIIAGPPGARCVQPSCAADPQTLGGGRPDMKPRTAIGYAQYSLGGRPMRRRDFIAGLGSAATWPLAARAQQPAMPVIGILQSGRTVRPPNFSPEFIQGLSEMGYVEGRNVALEWRGADQYDQLLALAADLVRLKVAVIYAASTANSAMAAKAATSTMTAVLREQFGLAPR